MNTDLKDRIIRRLRTVIDPETGADVVRMRLVQELEADDAGQVSYTFRPSSPFCPLAVTLAIQIKRAVAQVTDVKGQEIRVEGYIDAEGLVELLREVEQ